MSKSLITVDDKTLTERDFMASIDDVIEHLNKTGDLNKATSVLNDLDRLDNVTGHGKAKLLLGMYRWFESNVEVPDEEFEDHIKSTTTTKAITAERYITVWSKVESGEIPKNISNRPMRDLVPIAKCLAQGYSIDAKGWAKINLCSNDGELRDVLRKIKGKAERKSARVIKLARDGSLYLWKKNVKKFLGYLNVEDAKTDPDISEEIEKIKDKIGAITE